MAMVQQIAVLGPARNSLQFDMPWGIMPALLRLSGPVDDSRHYPGHLAARTVWSVVGVLWVIGSLARTIMALATVVLNRSEESTRRTDEITMTAAPSKHRQGS